MSLHDYLVSSTIRIPEIFVHPDDLLFQNLFRKIIRLYGILEPWNFGLSFSVNGQTNWINLDKDKYSTIKNLPTNSFNNFPLNFGIITYPLSVTKEIWSQSAVSLFFVDMYETSLKMEPNLDINKSRKPELYAIEYLIRKKATNEKNIISDRLIPVDMKEKFTAKLVELKSLTLFQLKRRYFDIIETSHFEKITGEFSCDNAETHITKTNKEMSLSRNGEKLKFKWEEVQLIKVKERSCIIITNKVKRILKFDSDCTAQQFYYVIGKHICQHVISFNEPHDAEFRIIKDISNKEQEHIQVAEKLQSDLESINTKNSAMYNDNACLAKLNDNMKVEIKLLNENKAMIMEEKISLESKIKIYEMKTSKATEYEKEIKALRKENETVKADKKSEIDKYKSEVDELKKKIMLLEDRVKRQSAPPKVEKKGSLTDAFKPLIPRSMIKETDLESGGVAMTKIDDGDQAINDGSRRERPFSKDNKNSKNAITEEGTLFQK